jgi:hypothetical protein
MNASGVDANIVARVAECIATAAHSGRPVPPVRALLGTSGWRQLVRSHPPGSHRSAQRSGSSRRNHHYTHSTLAMQC